MTTTPDTLAERYHRFNNRVQRAAHAAAADPRDIITVAVTKYAPLEAVHQLIDLGHRDLAENQVQQLTQRAALVGEHLQRKIDHPSLATTTEQQPTTQPADIRWHMIGSLQRNKVKKCLPLVRLTHSVDSLRLVEEINSVAIRKDIDAEILVQVNVTGESQKSGCPVGAAQHLCEQIDSLVHVHVRGLMAIGPTSQNENETRSAFERARELFDDIKDAGTNEGRFNILSMGMSNDFELAIHHGANLLRIGSAIFGPREQQPDDHAEHE